MKSIFTALVTVLALQSAHADTKGGLQIDGFGSLYMGQSSGDILASGATDKQPGFSQYSLLGLNLYSKLENNLSVGAQLLMRGTGSSVQTDATTILPTDKPYNLNAEWAFLSWDPTGDFSVRFGRLLFPTWIAGEYLNVGYLTPMRTLAPEVYNLAPFTAFDGLNISKTWSLGGPRLTTSIFGGTPALVYPSVSLSNMYGASVAAEGDGWSVKATYLALMARLAIPTLPQGSIGTFSKLSSLGYKIDMANVVSWGEAFYSTADKKSDLVPATTTQFAEEEAGGYVLLGYRIGKFLPRYTYAESHTRYGFLPNGKQKTHIVGVNYEINNQAAFKLEYQMTEVPYDATNPNSPVAGTAVEGTPVGAAATKVVTDSGKTKGNAVFAGFDFTF